MARFTIEQLILSDLLKRLIDLYYADDLFEHNKGISLKDALRKLTGLSKSLRVKFFDDRIKRRNSNPLFPGNIEIDYSQLDTFRDIMDGLCNSIIKGEYDHFALIRIEDNIETELSLSASLGNEETENPEESETEINWGIVRNLIDKGAVRSLRKQEGYFRGLGKLNISSKPYRILHVSPYSELARKILLSDPCEELPSAILSIHFPTWYSFIQIVRSILVNFYFVFDGFERLKVCKECQKLIFEKKKDSLLFCSVKCRRKHFNSTEHRKRRLCRERQNAWIRNYAAKKKRKTYWNVYKFECKDCNTFKSGDCPVLKRKNPDEKENNIGKKK